MIEDLGFEILDLNFGCPVRKVTGPGAGSALLRRPDLAMEIFKNVMAHVKKIPVTVKMRAGFTDPTGKEAIAIARLAEEQALMGNAAEARRYYLRAKAFYLKANASTEARLRCSARYQGSTLLTPPNSNSTLLR